MKISPGTARPMRLNLREPSGKPALNKTVCRLRANGWDPEARRSLQQVLRKGAGQRLPVVFDFDNTIVSGDIGEAVLAFLGRSGRLTLANISPSLGPAVNIGGKSLGTVQDCADIMQYYEALLAPTVHGKADATPLANGYIWATQALEGLSLAEVVQATAGACSALDLNGRVRTRRTQAHTHRYPAPRFRQEMVELIAELLRLEYQPWIVSASNVWSVRWIVAHVLNPLLAERGSKPGLRPQNVIGVATLLEDKNGRLHKDSVLIRDDFGYARLKPKALGSFYVTRHVQFPVPVYSGKVACILDALGSNPYLCAGDSPSDLPMLSISQHKLWIARPDKPEAQRASRALMRRTGRDGWIVQAASTMTATPEPSWSRQ
ncbi:MAG TPA: HAD family hydrolase [Verrucomicrobiae bacterium]|nr:HAD family hydrolase [Verrucomicrobiae bacterium]